MGENPAENEIKGGRQTEGDSEDFVKNRCLDVILKKHLQCHL